jgi:hypothetical protein
MNIRILIIIVFALHTQTSYADYDINEGRTLSLMVEELDFLIDTAREQSKKPSKSDLVFGYDALADDLLRIRELIRFHIENASKRPNQISPQTSGVDPVKGIYSQRKY